MSNQKGGVRVNPLKEWAAFDALPQPIRRVISLAPYDYQVSPFLRDYKQHIKDDGDLSSFRTYVVGKICDDLQRTARKTYGLDHPDAVHHRLEKARGHA